MDENTEEKKEIKTASRRNPLTIGIGNQETADRFLAVRNSTYAGTYEETLKILLDAYENPPQDADSAATIANLQQRIKGMEGEIASKDKEITDKDRVISDLRSKLENAISDANANAESGLGNQLKLEELQKRTEGAIILKPNPVVRHFLDEMAAKTGQTPDKILERLYLDDLQNPRSNNLPYTVSSSEIREVMRKLQKEEEE